MAGYDDTGFYNGAIDGWQDTVVQGANMIANGAYNIVAETSKWMEEAIPNNIWWTIKPDEKLPTAYATHRQATIAIDDLHFKKELYVSSIALSNFILALHPYFLAIDISIIFLGVPSGFDLSYLINIF